MKERGKRGRRPSPSMVVATIALFAAFGGSAAALKGKNTVNSGDVINNTLKSNDLKNGVAVRTQDVVDGTLTGADVADDSLTGDDVDESSLAQVPSAANANNASSLGGIAAANYQRRCLEGAVRGHALVDGSAGFSSTYTGTGVAEEFNCAGGAAQARRTAQGVYNVCFPGNFPFVAVASGINSGAASAGEDNLVTWRRTADGACSGGTAVEVRIVDNGGTLEDASFSVALL